MFKENKKAYAVFLTGRACECFDRQEIEKGLKLMAKAEFNAIMSGDKKLKAIIRDKAEDIRSKYIPS